jgi:hypothetical protein
MLIAVSRALGAFGLVCLLAAGQAQAQTQSKNLAPGFTALPKGAKVVVMPPDIELFSISGGGVLEPKADWTETAQKLVRGALKARETKWGATTSELTESDADDFAEISALNAAISQSIAFHHMTGGNLALPTKAGLLDWSMAEAITPVQVKSQADYALFIWIRDSYASAERKAAFIAMAAFGVGIPLGAQIGYASLVDLRTGRIVWFNRMGRASGDLREPGPAAESLDLLLTQFPVAK